MTSQGKYAEQSAARLLELVNQFEAGLSAASSHVVTQLMYRPWNLRMSLALMMKTCMHPLAWLTLLTKQQPQVRRHISRKVAVQGRQDPLRGSQGVLGAPLLLPV